MSLEESKRRGRRRWTLWLLLVVGGLGVPFCFLNMAAAGSFSVACDVAHPEVCAHWRRVGIVYGLLFYAAGLLFLGTAIALVWTRRRAADVPDEGGAPAA